MPDNVSEPAVDLAADQAAAPPSTPPPSAAGPTDDVPTGAPPAGDAAAGDAAAGDAASGDAVAGDAAAAGDVAADDGAAADVTAQAADVAVPHVADVQVSSALASSPEAIDTPMAIPETVVLAEMARTVLTDRMGIVLVEASPDLVVGTMPVEGNTQPYGLLHGGASCVLAETLGSIGAALHGARQGKIAVGIEINATHHRSASTGVVTGTARPVHLGGTLVSYEIVIVDARDRRVCTARLTCMLRANPASGR